MTNIIRSEAIRKFLVHSTHADLAGLYMKGMECQVNASQDGGEKIGGEFKGRQWSAWQDPNTGNKWSSFRIPRNAKSFPEDNDTPMNWSIEDHVEGIGMTGWNWQQKMSMWVAFDFDDITGHSDRHGQKITTEQLQEVQDAASKIPWTTIRKSTSGKGLHIYVFLDNIPTINHLEHAALARAILGKMSALTGFDFSARVDVCGHNMWVWHRKMKGTDGLTLLKKGSVLEEAPPNWLDHLNVVNGSRKRTLPKFVEGESVDAFLELSGQNARIQLDEEHKKLILFLEENKCVAWWDADHHMLVTHTYHLKEAHSKLSLRGLFDTLSVGKDYGNDINCYLFPLRRGSWTVRRYTPGVQEHPSWTQDGSGWTRCFYNHEPDLATASRSFGGVEHTSGGFVFREAGIAAEAAARMKVNIGLPDWLIKRSAKLKTHKDGRLIVEIQRDSHDVPVGTEMDGWISEKGLWKRIYGGIPQANPEADVSNYDDMVRHLITENGSDYGWVIKRDNQWGDESYSNIKIAMKASGVNFKDIDLILGNSVMKPWKVVNRPFQPEFPGDRQWNRDAAQFLYIPNTKSEFKHYPTWLKILNHVGSNLDAAIAENSWAQVNAIKTGADYLKIWLASLFQYPLEPLPYLFLWGPQDSGKSIFHESISRILSKGYVRADNALINPSGFNAELRYAILCVVEEIDLKKNKLAYARIKDWVTSLMLPVHEKGETPIGLPNSTHWVQCSNSKDACPVFPGDTRITMIHVPSLSPLEMIPKGLLLKELEKEAPDFLGELMTLELPPPASRLNVEVITTQDKIELQKANRTALEEFIEDRVHAVDGKMIKFSEFYAKFIESLDAGEVGSWTKQKVSSNMPSHFPKGRNSSDNGQWYWGNISWEPLQPGEAVLPKLTVEGQMLR